MTDWNDKLKIAVFGVTRVFIGGELDSSLGDGDLLKTYSAEHLEEPLKNGADPNMIVDSSGRRNALEYCAYYGAAEAVEILLKYGAKPSTKALVNIIDDWERTPRKKNIRILKALLEHGARPDEKIGSISALKLAERRGYKVAVDLFRKKLKKEFKEASRKKEKERQHDKQTALRKFLRKHRPH